MPMVVAGTGYTGEDGVEVSIPADDARVFWDALLVAGITPAGLGARDTLRLEAGLPLHGHELGAGHHVVASGTRLGRQLDQGRLPRPRPARGREGARASRASCAASTTEGRRPPRAEQSVLRDGQAVGEVTSGNFSPELGHGIALAFVPPDVEIGDELAIDVRGTAMPATVVKPPFIAKN